MTLLVAWAGIDTHGITSAYVAADSRISWGDTARFDHGRKVFGLTRFPDLFGYCGDVLFPSLVLGQISEMADSGLLFPHDATAETKAQAVFEKLIDQFNKYPGDVANIAQDVIQVIHVSKGVEKSPGYKAFIFEWRRARAWSKHTLTFPSKSGVLTALGSGSVCFNRKLSQYDVGPNSGTSRAVFHCFCSTVASKADPHTGGAPQLIGLYRGLDPKARRFGIISNGNRYLFGAQIEGAFDYNQIEWRNELFEVCDGDAMQRKQGAQPQPDPLRLQ